MAMAKIAQAGVAYCRGATDSPNTPSGYTHVGGSSILIVSDNITGFAPAVIGKYREGAADDGNGKGLARAYIATTLDNNSESLIPDDQGLYALDSISNPGELMSQGFTSFGQGCDSHMFNDCNHYCKVTAQNGNVYTIDSVIPITPGVNYRLVPGRLVMFHYMEKTLGGSRRWNGRFDFAHVTAVDTANSTITLDGAAVGVSPSVYHVQIIGIPEFGDLDLSGQTLTCQKWSDGKGGIFAIACNGTLNLSDTIIDVTGKGTDRDYVNDIEGNATMFNRLPIGAGHGSVFILAKHIIMNANTRIGATYSGKATNIGSGYGGGGGNFGGYSGGGIKGRGGTSGDWGGDKGGSGGGGGTGYNGHDGGWHGNAVGASAENGGRQGAHIIIVADKITGFNLAAISTGGEGGAGSYGAGSGGSCGYGGGGGTSPMGSPIGSAGTECGGGGGGIKGGGGGTGTGGGAAGGAFIYCNEYVNADFTNVLG